MRTRDWRRAIEHHHGDGCRCELDGGCRGKIDLAHVLPRAYDHPEFPEVHPWSVITLCRYHHDRYDGRDHPPLDLFPFLDELELAYAFGRVGEGRALALISGRAERAAA